jgi:hypothetical protein
LEVFCKFQNNLHNTIDKIDEFHIKISISFNFLVNNTCPMKLSV